MKLKDALGQPGKGIHFHVFGFAVMNVLATIAVGCLIGWLVDHYELSAWPVWCLMIHYTFLLFLFGEFIHMAIGVDTAFLNWLAGDLWGD